jgi:hypothetical protein
MKIHKTKTDTIIGWLIRKYTRSNVNHCWIEFNGRSYEANGSVRGFLFPNANWEDEGVVTKKGPGNGEVIETLEYKVVDKARLQKFLDEQVGKKYDYEAILTMAGTGEYPVNIPKMGYWYCSELADVARQIAQGVVDPQANMIYPSSL